MPRVDRDMKELARRGQDYYDRFLRDELEPEHKGKYLVLDLDTGDYEMDRNELEAFDRARTRMPGKVFYFLRVGYPTAYRLGFRSSRKQS